MCYYDHVADAADGHISAARLLADYEMNVAKRREQEHEDL